MFTYTTNADVPTKPVTLHSAYCRLGALQPMGRADGDLHELKSRMMSSTAGPCDSDSEVSSVTIAKTVNRLTRNALTLWRDTRSHVGGGRERREDEQTDWWLR